MFNTDGTKYHPLFEHLLFTGQGQVTMTFAEIEAVLGAKLPPSARTHEEWWSNSPNGHSQARAWMRAGYETSGIDLAGNNVTFTLEGWPDRYQRAAGLVVPRQGGLADTPQAPLTRQGEGDHPLFGVWKGKVRLLPDYDYAAPAFDPGDGVAQ